MSARFILSLDCEGKWGVADLLDKGLHAALGDQSLKQAYRTLISLLDEFEIPATFAFVGAFAEPREALFEKLGSLNDFRTIAPDYIGPAIVDMTDGSREGWHGAWAVDLVGAADEKHEIALHGVTHIPWDRFTREQAKKELDFLSSMESPVRHSRTFIYPRNRVAHVDILAEMGMMAYRKAPPLQTRAMSFASEFNLWEKAQPDGRLENSLVTIPSGFFVNWQAGLRKAVPRVASAARARRLLNDAAHNEQIVHYWLHPENLATAPGTINQLRDILKVVREARDRGKCAVLTQEQYAASQI